MKFIIFILTALTIRRLALLLIVVKRRCVPIEELQTALNCRKHGLEALRTLSKMYSIKPGYIRASDPLCRKGFLTLYDSWNFNSGYNALEDFVKCNNGTIDEKWVVADFIDWYETRMEATKR